MRRGTDVLTFSVRLDETHSTILFKLLDKFGSGFKGHSAPSAVLSVRFRKMLRALEEQLMPKQPEEDSQLPAAQGEEEEEPEEEAEQPYTPNIQFVDGEPEE